MNTPLQPDDFPVGIRPFAKRNERFYGNGMANCPYVGGWVIDDRELSYDNEAHSWLKSHGFTHKGRRWSRPDQ